MAASVEFIEGVRGFLLLFWTVIPITNRKRWQMAWSSHVARGKVWSVRHVWWSAMMELWWRLNIATITNSTLVTYKRDSWEETWGMRRLQCWRFTIRKRWNCFNKVRLRWLHSASIPASQVITVQWTEEMVLHNAIHKRWHWPGWPVENSGSRRSVPAWRGWRWSWQENSVCIQLRSACASECWYLSNGWDVCNKTKAVLSNSHIACIRSWSDAATCIWSAPPNKDGNTYIRFLSLVKEKYESIGFTISPQRIIQDFEKGLVNACLHVFPGVIVKGCYFHYAQWMWRRIQGIGLSVSYRENVDHRNWFRMLLAMPFVPVPHVKDAF